MRCRLSLLLISGLLLATAVSAQHDTISRGMADSLRISARVTWQAHRLDLGRPTEADITLTYPAHYKLLLPDSIKGYPGLERVRQVYTHTRGGLVAQDSLWLELRTWEIEDQQMLAPIFRLVTGTDTLVWLPTSDTLAFAARIPNYHDGLPLKPDYTLLPVVRPFDWAGWLLFVTGVLVLLGIAGWLLRRPVARWWHRRQLERRYRDLKNALAQQHQRAEREPLEALNTLNALWKTWLEADWDTCLRSLTAREVVAVLSLRKELAEAERDLLFELVRMEEHCNYAGQPLARTWWQDTYPRLISLLDTLLARRMASLNL